MTRWLTLGGAMVCLAAIGLVPLLMSPANAIAQETNALNKQDQTAPRDVTLTGRIVDMHCCMTGEYPTKDYVKCTAQCIKRGVPSALETDSGLVILGHGLDGPARMVAPMAYEQVEVTGKLHEKHGIKYLDMVSIRKAGKTTEEPGMDEGEMPEP